MKHIVKFRGTEVECYGLLEENSNFDVVCEDEYHDACWCEGNTDTDEPFKTWEECVEFLEGSYGSTILQITAV